MKLRLQLWWKVEALVEKVVYVYDSSLSPGRTCWRKGELTKLAVLFCSVKLLEKFIASQIKLCCLLNDLYIIHPVFGRSLRKGQVLMKNGNVMYFTIK